MHQPFGWQDLSGVSGFADRACALAAVTTCARAPGGVRNVASYMMTVPRAYEPPKQWTEPAEKADPSFALRSGVRPFNGKSIPPMRLIDFTSMPAGQADFVCRVSGRRTLLVALACFTVGCAALVIGIAGISSDPLVHAAFYGASAVCIAFSLLGYASYRRTLDQANWVCQRKDGKLFFKCGRFWGEGGGADFRVLELLRRDVAWVQPLKVHSMEDERAPNDWLHKRAGGVVHEWVAYLDVGLSEPGVVAIQALANDGRIKPQERQLLFPDGYIPDQPVQLMKDGTIRVRWGDAISNVTPGIESIPPLLAGFTEVRALRRETVRRFFQEPLDDAEK